jgi:hypothetical protein
MAAAAQADVYRQREAQKTVLYQVVAETLPDFIEQAEAGAYSMPAFVQGELEAFLAYGDPRRGFTHPKCPRCGFDRFLPFS